MKNVKIFIMLVSAIVAFSVAAIAVPQKQSQSADQIMQRFTKNTLALHRFICTMEVQVYGFGNSPSLKRVEKDRVVFDGPRHIAVHELSFSVTGPDGPIKEAFAYPRYYHDIVADGKDYYVLRSDQKEFILHKLNAKGVVAEDEGAGIFSDFTFGALLLSSGDKKLVALVTGGNLLGTQVLDNVVCDKVEITESFELPDGTKHNAKDIYWIAHKDGLLRRFETKSPGSDIIESYNIKQIGGVISPSEFLIKPPATAKQVDSF
jgi:hypothetical protein